MVDGGNTVVASKEGLTGKVMADDGCMMVKNIRKILFYFICKENNEK